MRGLPANLMPSLPRWSPRRLSTRIVVVFLGLLLLVQLLGFAAVRYSIAHNARALLAENLAFGEQVWRRLLEQRAEKLTLAARVLATDWGFRTAVLAGDTGTLASALGNHGGRVGASVSAMLTPAGRPLALGEGSDEHTLEALRQLSSLPAAEDGNVLALVDGLPHQLVVVPMRAPDLKGRVVMGFALDEGLVQDMRRITGLEVAVVVADADGARRVVLSTLAPEAASELAAPSGAEGAGGDLQLGDAPHLAHAVTLLDGAPGRPALQALLLRSIDDAVAPYRDLQATLAAITLGGLLLAGSASVFTARRVTTPLRALAGASERLGRGHYDEPLEHVSREDEIGDLAKAFDHMRVSIAAHESEIRQLAYWDRLTGLPNRARFRDAVRAAIADAASGGRPVAVVMLDLDRFKHVNDVLGYAFGDRLLKAVAARQTGHAVREGDLIARLSGDEFALLLPGSSAAQALAVAERIAEAFQAPLTLDDHTVDLAAGFGVACWPDHAGDADALISRAEVAMYTAKRKTTSALVYDPAIDAGSAETLSLLSELRRALERDELRLFLQPKVALASGRIVAAEALVRWQHPERGMVPPMQFIPFAEQTGFVRQLTLWMFEACAREWPALQALGVQRVSVNLSTRDLLDLELPQRLQAILGRLGVAPQAFCLEITESAIMDEPQRALAILEALSAAGFKLSIDDFGTGYSSLAYLKRLPVDELKIDKSFVMGMERDEQDAKIVRSTIDLAHNLGLTVVAEGVENEAIWRQLVALHCDEAQGYHMSRPLPAAELPAFAARWAERVATAQAG